MICKKIIKYLFILEEKMNYKIYGIFKWVKLTQTDIRLQRVSKEAVKLIFVFKWDESSQMLESILQVIKQAKNDFIFIKDKFWTTWPKST